MPCVVFLYGHLLVIVSCLMYLMIRWYKNNTICILFLEIVLILKNKKKTLHQKLKSSPQNEIANQLSVLFRTCGLPSPRNVATCGLQLSITAVLGCLFSSKRQMMCKLRSLDRRLTCWQYLQQLMEQVVGHKGCFIGSEMWGETICKSDVVRSWD